DWPFFGDDHRRFAGELERWTDESLGVIDHVDVDATCRALVADLGAGGWLRHAAVDPGGGDALDVRTLCPAREILARRDGLADFAFALQGLGSGAISLAGSESQKRRWLPAVRSGRAIAAFALTEARSGSDVAAIDTTARREDDGWVLDGEKTWISNGGIADFYTVFARTGEGPGAKGLSAFIVPADAPGLEVVE